MYQTGYHVLKEFLNSGFLDQSAILKFETFEQSLNLSIDCAFELYKITGDQQYYNRAFQFIENNRYFLLQQALANSDHKFLTGVSDSLFYKQKLLNKDIIELNRELDVQSIADSSFNIRNRLIEKINLKAAIENEIELHGEQTKASILDSLVLNISDVQNSILKENEVIIEFNWSDESLYALTIGRDFLDVHKSAITSELIQSIHDYVEIISDESDSSRYSKFEFQRFINSSLYLYENVLKPVLDKVETNPKSIEKIDRIIIVPDGDLSYLPFESLITYTPDTSTVSYWGLPYLCNEYTISYAYSLNILKRNLFRPESIIGPKFLGFSYSAPLKSNEDIALLRSENELPYSSEELDRIKNWIKRATFFKNERATEDVFKSEASNYTLIHLALHGLADTSDMFNSSLKFKINENSIEDGELHAFELYDMDLSQTELAVLSACETGLGKQTEGEGIFSIARGFAYAGCPAIVMSLWKVNDKSTAKLMDYFYEYLANGLQKDKALQKAKLAFIQNSDDLGTHPANWAAFIALGNNQPIQVPKALLQWYHWMLILAFVSGIFFIYLRRKIIAFYS